MSNPARSLVLTGTMLPPMEVLSASLQTSRSVLVKQNAAGLREAMGQWGASPDSLVAGLHDPAIPTHDALAQAFWLIEAIQLCRATGGRLPRYAIGLYPSSRVVDAAVIHAATASLMRYATSHLLFDDISVNLISYVDTAPGHQRAADAAQALMSGLLDMVRGQSLHITDE